MKGLFVSAAMTALLSPASAMIAISSESNKIQKTYHQHN
ncbi:hypothetical protein SynROS8604_01445 [Synechococcus sp. ROS8604]|nr:hypothetical protein SynROS8604_01445 [Synechococcus sp. ROS8604]